MKKKWVDLINDKYFEIFDKNILSVLSKSLRVCYYKRTSAVTSVALVLGKKTSSFFLPKEELGKIEKQVKKREKHFLTK